MPTVVPGKLKLKGLSKNDKKKKKRRRRDDESESQKESSSSTNHNDNTDNTSLTTKETLLDYDEFLTDTQKKFEQKKRKIELMKAKEVSATTYRDRVEKFNYELSIKSEHNDIPRVSAAGNG